MATVLISEAEKTYILHGVQEDLRTDGRGRIDLRPMVVETDLVTHASGSAHLRLANTDVLVAVKAELDRPRPEEPSRGRLEFFVDCSANAAPEFEGRGGEDLAAEISRVLTRAYREDTGGGEDKGDVVVFDLSQLCVLERHHCWVLYIDILILECGGNLFDAVSLAVKAALFSTRLPSVSVTAVDGGQPELELSDDPYAGRRLDMGEAPVLVTLSRIGNHCVVDPTPEEEACSSASLVVGVTAGGKVTTARMKGSGSFHHETMVEAVKVGTDVGVRLNEALCLKLKEEEKQNQKRNTSEKIGFLK